MSATARRSLDDIVTPSILTEGLPNGRRLGAVVVAALTSLVAIVAASVVVAVPATAIGRPARRSTVRLKAGVDPACGYRIAAYVQPGRGPAIVLSHGFPDNHHLYDRVVPVAQRDARS